MKKTRILATLLAVVFMVAAAVIPVTAVSVVQTASAATNPGQSTVIAFTMGSTTYTVNGASRTLATAPFNQGNRPRIPVRELADALNVHVGWDNAANAVLLDPIGDWEDWVAVTIRMNDSASGSLLREGRAFIAIDFVELMASFLKYNATADWNAAQQTVTITAVYVPPRTHTEINVTMPDNLPPEVQGTFDALFQDFIRRNSPLPNAENVASVAAVTPRTVGAEHLSFAPTAFELEVFEAVNADRVSKGFNELEWNDLLAQSARWRSRNNAMFVNAQSIEPASLTMTASANLSTQPVLDRVNLVGFFQGNVYHTTERSRSYGSGATMLGVGHDPSSGLVTLAFINSSFFDTSDAVPGHDLVLHGGFPFWLPDSPYAEAFFDTFNPFWVPHLITQGYSEDEIMEMWEQEIFRLTNEVRVSHGRRPVTWDNSLASAARVYSLDPGGMGHIGSDGSTPTDRAIREGWTGRGVLENAGGVTSSPLSVVAAWLISPGHRANLLNPAHTHLGVGFAHAEDLTRWSEELHWSVDILERRVSGVPVATQKFGTR